MVPNPLNRECRTKQRLYSGIGNQNSNSTQNGESPSHLVETEEHLARAAEVKVEALDRRVELCALQVGGLHFVVLLPRDVVLVPHLLLGLGCSRSSAE